MEGSTPTYGDAFGTVPVATPVASWELPAPFPWQRAEPWRLDNAIRYACSEGTENWFSRWSPSTVLRMPVSERFEVHAEWFGSFTDGLTDASSARAARRDRRRRHARPAGGPGRPCS